MSALPSPLPDASPTRRGALTNAPQEIGGPKTLLDNLTEHDTVIASGDWELEFDDEPITGLPLHFGGGGGDIAAFFETPGFRRFAVGDERNFVLGTSDFGLTFDENEETIRVDGTLDAGFIVADSLNASSVVTSDLTATNVNGAPYIASPITAVDSTTGVEIDGTTLKGKAATGSVWGVLTVVAQQIAGVKTFLDGLAALDATITNLLQAGSVAITTTLSAGVSTLASVVTNLVRAAGASLVLRSSLGASAAHVAVKLGTSETDGNTHSGAVLSGEYTGLGGTEVLRWYRTKTVFGMPAGAVLQWNDVWSTSITAGSAYLYLNSNVFARDSLSMNNYWRSSVAAGGRVDLWGWDMSGTPGNHTLNRPSGIATIEAGASSITISNSFVPNPATTKVRLVLTWRGDHGAARSWWTQGNGTITVNLSAPASANTSFDWAIEGLL